MTSSEIVEFARKGGKARAEALSPEKRREIALRASQARWRGHKKRPPTAK